MKFEKDNKEIEASKKAFRVIYEGQGYIPVSSREALKVETEETGQNERKQLEDMTLTELKVLAKEKGMETVSALNKEELLEVLRDAISND